MARRTRAEVSESNRRAVLRAAREHFETQGFHGASLDVIAEGAGFSKGAVYSRFASKSDLFLAALDDHIERRVEATRARLDELDDADLATLAKVAIETSVATVAWQAALLEFRAHAWRDPEINARYAALHQRTVDSIAQFMAEVHRRRDATSPVAFEDMARAALAIGTGVVAEYMANPGLDVETLIDVSVSGPGAPTHIPAARAEAAP